MVRRVIFWGTYDDDKPRVRILRDGLRDNGWEVVEINISPWRGVRDKSTIKGPLAFASLAGRLLLAYVSLIGRLIYQRELSKVIVVPYLGQFDVLVLSLLRPFVRRHIVLDIFISLYDTVVEDRNLLTARHPAARCLKVLERLSITRADLPLIDTAAHARRLESFYELSPYGISHVLVGVEDEQFPASAPIQKDAGSPLQVLFYGQFSPLHGIETILAAASQLADREIDWLIIGTGQDTAIMRRFLDGAKRHRVTWIEWVSYSELASAIAKADVCLGIFGDSEKAASVIPNKAFQIAAVGRYLVTRDGPGIRELFDERDAGVTLIPPRDPGALARALVELSESVKELRTEVYHQHHRAAIERRAIGAAFAEQIENSLSRASSP